jgi:hypothetical protein
MAWSCNATAPHWWQWREEVFMTIRAGVIAAFIALIALLAACGPIDSLKEGFEQAPRQVVISFAIEP